MRLTAKQKRAIEQAEKNLALPRFQDVRSFLVVIDSREHKQIVPAFFPIFNCSQKDSEYSRLDRYVSEGVPFCAIVFRENEDDLRALVYRDGFEILLHKL